MATPTDFAGILHTLRNDRWCVSESVYAPGTRMPSHGHPNSYVSYVVDGAYDEVIGACRNGCAQGFLVSHGAGEEHAVSFSNASTRILRIEITDPRALMLEQHEIASDPKPLANARLRSRFTDLGAELRASDAYTHLAVSGIIYDILSSLGRNRLTECRIPVWLRRVHESIVATPTIKVTLGELAALADVDPSYLSRTFRRFYGTSIGAYQRSAMCDKACALLRRPDARITEIALQLGFADQSHFTRTFKRVIGMTPRAYQLTVQAS